MGSVFCFADHYLDNLAILTEILLASQCLEELVFLCRGAQTSDVYEILLHHSEAGQVFPAEGVCFSFLGFFLCGSNVLLLALRLLRLPRSFSGGVLDVDLAMKHMY